MTRQVAYLESFLAAQEGSPNLDSLVKDAVDGDIKPLQDQLVAYFASIRVTNPETKVEELPKRTTFDATLSHIKCTVLEKSEGIIDIQVNARFTELGMFLDGFKKKLKAEGKGDITHYEGK